MTISSGRIANLASTAITLAALAAASWFVWMAWDTTYYENDQGIATGPYAAWQVLGCAATLLVLALVGAVLVHPLTVVLMPPAFTIAWSFTAARDDETGLWAIGAMFLFVSLSAAAAVVGLAGWGLRAALDKRRDG